MKITFGILLIWLTFSGCVTEKRCMEKFPASTQTIIRDTTIITNSKSFDTLISFQSRDTIFIRDWKTKIETQLVRVNDSVFVKTICPGDTIRVEKVIQNIIKHEPVEQTKIPWWLVGITLLVLVLSIILQFKR